MIVWDLGDVAATFRPERRLAELAAASGIPAAEIERRLWGSGLDAAAELGKIAADELWDQTIAALDRRLTREDIRRCWASAFTPNLVVLNFIDQLAGPCVLLSNNGPIVEACLAHELRDLGRRFDRIVLSCHLRATKPSTDAFNRATDLLGVNARDLLLIDDQQANIAGARAAGWSGMRFRQA